MPLLHSFGKTATQIVTQLESSWERIWPAVARRRSTAARPRFSSPMVVLRSPDVRATLLVLPRGLLHKAPEFATHFCYTTFEVYEVLGSLRPSVSRAKCIEIRFIERRLFVAYG